MKKANKLHDWVRANIETRLLLYIGMEILRYKLEEYQARFDTVIDLDDLAGIREQEIAQERGYI